MADLATLTSELEDLARRLRAPGLEPDQAARLVQRCAQAAGEAAAELDRQARATEPPPGQTALL